MLEAYFYGYLGWSWTAMVIYLLVVTHITIVSVTLFLHRCQAHRALDLHPILSHFFRFWLFMTTGQDTKAWAAIHRKHHAKCETAEDPHSPVMLGLKKVLTEGAELYRYEAKNEETLTRYGTGTPDDWMERKIYHPHSAKGIFVLLAINVFLFGVPGIAIWGLQMAWIPFFAAGIVNGVAHALGYRNFESPDASTNLIPWGLFIGGEELHNNHHAYPSSARFAMKWWEVDIGWMYVCLFRALGLAKVRRVAKITKQSPMTEWQVNTLTALLHHRFEVMTRYTREVLIPYGRELPVKDYGVWKKVRGILGRPAMSISAADRELLKGFLAEHTPIERVYAMKERLQEIWDKTTASPKELLEALQAWSKEAESLGIESLNRFVEGLRSYTMVPTKA